MGATHSAKDYVFQKFLFSKRKKKINSFLSSLLNFSPEDKRKLMVKLPLENHVFKLIVKDKFTKQVHTKSLAFQL